VNGIGHAKSSAACSATSWDLQSHKLTLCYELAADFADLYREYGARADGGRIADRSKRKTVSTSAFKANLRPIQRKRKLSH
jgi:hypothetical protein